MKLDKNIIILIAVGLLLTSPCLIYGFPFYGDDSVWNAIFYSEFAGQFWSGELYPRWLQDLNGGLGNPTAFYYPPLSYWLTGLFKPLFRHDPLGWFQLGVSAAFAVTASGLAIYQWLVRIVGTRSAVLASIVYLIVPYHVDIDVYARGALAEAWSFVLMPLVLWAVDACIARKRFAFAGLAWAYAALVMTHLPTTLIFSFIPPAYSLCTVPTGARVRALLLTVGAMTLGAGLAAIYLLPAMSMQDFIFHTTQGIGGHYYFANWFLFSMLKWSGKYSEYFMASITVTVLASLAFAIGRVIIEPSMKRRMWFWFVVAGLCFFMMTPLSKPVWILLPTLQKVQFPFRFNTVLSLAAACLVGVSFQGSTGRARRLFLGVLVVLGLVWTFGTARRAYYSYPAIYMDQVVFDSATKRLRQRRDTNEFRPRWVSSIEENELDMILSGVGESQVKVVSGEASVVVETWVPREISLRVNAPTGATLNISRFYFPGWVLLVGDGKVAHPVEPSMPGGLIHARVPAGNHRLTLQLRKRWPELAGEVVSLVSLLIVSLLVVVAYRGSPRGKNAEGVR